jgi:drug/metabolite transporter (DMT)-like permease
MPVPTLIFWRNLGGSLVTLPFALRHKLNRIGVKWAVLAGVVLAVFISVSSYSMRLTSVTAGTAIVATQPIFAAFSRQTYWRTYSNKSMVWHVD